MTEAELRAAHCWEAVDKVPGRPQMTEFRRRARLHQARWREAAGHPIGTQPIRPKPGGEARLVGSRLPLDYALETGATFVTPAALAAAKARSAFKERHQSWDAQRLWADLLWSPTATCNLFGDLAADVSLADRAVHAWWPDTPGRVADVRFAHSPGRLDLRYTGSLVDLDAAFVLDDGVVGVTVHYHDALQSNTPKPERIGRYLEVAAQSGAFNQAEQPPGVLLVLWLRHLLLFSMRPTWTRLVVVHPAGNTDYAAACEEYRSLLARPETFASTTFEELLDSGALPRRSAAALRRRYVVNR